MTFKNNLISKEKGKAQVVIEYIIIFIAFVLTAITFISQIHNSAGNGVYDEHFDEMVRTILGWWMKKNAQSVIEYAMLVAVVAAAFIAMTQYVNRAISARLKQVQEEIVEEPEPGVSVP